MKRISKYLFILQILTLFSLFGCAADLTPNEEEDDSDSSGSITLSTLVGTYSLDSFTVTRDDGTVFSDDDYSSVSGSFVISQSGVCTQTITVDGNEATVLFTVSVKNNYTLSVVPQSGDCNYDLLFSYSGNTLTTTFSSGTCGANFKEVDVWKKVSVNSSAPELDRDLLPHAPLYNASLPGGVAGVF